MPVTLPTLTDRERLTTVLRTLDHYGVTACADLPGHPDELRGRIRRAILARFPDAMGSFVFWTSEDARALAADGSLRGALTLHASDDEVLGLLRGALTDAGLDSGPGALPHTVSVRPVD